MSGTRGLRNNNPGNIRISGDRFQGQVIPGADKAFKQFKNMAWGYRAMFVILATYSTEYRRNTIRKIISAWAPPGENDTPGYIASVVKFSGVKADGILTLDSGEEYIKIVSAMSRVENGVPANMGDVKAGFELQDKITV